MGEDEGLGREANKSGQPADLQAKGPPFYSIQKEYLAFPLTGYGEAPGGDAYVIQIVYKPPDGPPATVAGYISVPNYDVSEFFDENVYRIAADLSRVKSALEARVEAAQTILSRGGGETLDGYDTGRRALTNLEQKIALLQQALADLKKVMDGGWTHIILGTARTEGDKDVLDLNLDFFTVFYPEAAFPLAGHTGGDPGREFWVNRDYFLWGLFPKGESTDSRYLGTKLPNRFDYALEASEFPRLKITFNHSSIDVLNANAGKAQKLVSTKRWPSIKEILAEVQNDLKKNPYGRDADKARRRSMKKAVTLMRRAEKNRKAKKTKAAEANEKGCEQIFDDVRESLGKEQDKLIDDINNVTDPTSGELDAKSKDALQNLGEIQLMSAGTPEEEDQFKRTFDAAKAQYEKRDEKLQEKIGQMDAHDPEFDKTVKKGLDTQATLQGIGGEHSKPLFETLAQKYHKAIDDMAGPQPWDARKFLNFFRQSQTVGDSYKASDATWAKLREKNRVAMEQRFDRNPKLDRDLKLLISMHVLFFAAPLPERMLKNGPIKAYMEKEKSMRGKKVTKEPVEASAPAQAPGRDDPNRVKAK